MCLNGDTNSHLSGLCGMMPSSSLIVFRNMVGKVNEDMCVI